MKVFHFNDHNILRHTVMLKHVYDVVDAHGGTEFTYVGNSTQRNSTMSMRQSDDTAW